MPVHDWTRVDPAVFHAFHGSWIARLMAAMNDGVLPAGYYAMGEWVTSCRDVGTQTLRRPAEKQKVSEIGGVAIADAPPHARLSVRPDPKRKPLRQIRRGRQLVVRHVSGHHIVALLEIVSPSNKDRKASVRDLAEKVVNNLESAIHVLLVDLLPPGLHDPRGMHGAVWEFFDRKPYKAPPDEPLTVASYVWDGTEPEAFIEPVAVGQPLIDMPLFLSAERYVNVPLETTYQTAYRGMPEFWRNVVEGKESLNEE